MSCAGKVAKGGGDGFFILPSHHLWNVSVVSDTRGKIGMRPKSLT